jgi:two-component system, OmpR family, sensor histidine kinase BaeS
VGGSDDGFPAVRRPSGLSVRILVASLVVAAVSIAILAVGVLRVGGDAFAALMMAAGDSADHAREMFDTSVAGVVAITAIVAGAVALTLALFLARMLARPIERLAEAADRVAADGPAERVPVTGPAELQRLAAAYNAMAERLDEQESLRREFIVNASHELRTPLTNLQGYLEALRDGVIEPEPRVFDSLREEVDRLTRLAASLDVLAAAPWTALQAEAADVDVAAAARTAAELVAPALARRGISLEVDATGPARARVRPDALAQALANLLQNAERYTPDGGRVAVRAEHTTGGVGEAAAIVVVVGNSGPSIPPDALPRVFDRFYRVEQSRDRARGGAGIGLAIVRQLVEADGGEVSVTSSGDWTAFSVRYPATRPA